MTQAQLRIDEMSGRAELSECGRYRYTLERAWAALPRYVLWVMLNPSTADATKNDATIRRCIGYAAAWGYTGILVGNLYAQRSTDPRALDGWHRGGVDIIGEHNRRHLVGLARRASLIVCAWGQPGPDPEARRGAVDAIITSGTYNGMHALRINANGEPAHPLRLAKDLQARRWNPYRADLSE